VIHLDEYFRSGGTIFRKVAHGEGGVGLSALVVIESTNEIHVSNSQRLIPWRTPIE
jgi:hypothetical protein